MEVIPSRLQCAELLIAAFRQAVENQQEFTRAVATVRRFSPLTSGHSEVNIPQSVTEWITNPRGRRQNPTVQR